MVKTFLYQQIVEAIRQDILHKRLQAGDRLPPVREMAARWGCTVGTVQRAYTELAGEGLLISRPGRGTQVRSLPPAEESSMLRRILLVHQVEAFLTEVLTAGYTPVEVEQAMRLALDRWRTLSRDLADWPENILRFVGSHDPAMVLIMSRLVEVIPGYGTDLTFTGSLGGLIALAEGQADLAGTHLWDEESDTYNAPYVQRLLPGKRVGLLTLAHRRLGLIVPPSNPAKITGLKDLTRPGLRFINRQPGAGTRLWLEAQLRYLGIATDSISGYKVEAQTHSEVAQAVAEGRADVGLGVEAAALAYDLDFCFLTTERYDLVIPAATWKKPPVQALVHWLATDEAKETIMELGGYDVAQTGQVEWLNN